MIRIIGEFGMCWVGVLVRYMLIEVVVKDWGVVVFELMVKNSVVLYVGLGKFVIYGELVSFVVDFEFFVKLMLKDFKMFEFIGMI